MACPAFTPPFLPLRPLLPRVNPPSSLSCSNPPRLPLSRQTFRALEPTPDPPPDLRKSLFVNEEQVAFWNSLDTKSAFGPLTEEEKARLREKLPRRLAEFLIRRADDAVEQRDAIHTDKTFFGRLFKDMPPDVPDQDSEDNEEFKDYVYESTLGPPSYRRRGSSLFGGGDGLPDVEDVSGKTEIVEGKKVARKNIWSLFVGNVNSVDEQASKVGYSLLVLVAAFVLFRVLVAFVSFFVSFTFSFFAIFALSAGIFVVFFLLRF